MAEHFINEIDWFVIRDNLMLLALAYALAVPVGWNRERKSQSAGLRTFPLVSIAACAYMLTARAVFDDAEAHARVVYGIITGIGFVGGGAILKSDGEVSGTATAAGIWCTGAIGIAVAWQRFEIALITAATCFLTFKAKSSVHEESS